jgi:hypothetical protein
MDFAACADMVGADVEAFDFGALPDGNALVPSRKLPE